MRRPGVLLGAVALALAPCRCGCSWLFTACHPWPAAFELTLRRRRLLVWSLTIVGWSGGGGNRTSAFQAREREATAHMFSMMWATDNLRGLDSFAQDSRRMQTHIACGSRVWSAPAGRIQARGGSSKVYPLPTPTASMTCSNPGNALSSARSQHTPRPHGLARPTFRSLKVEAPLFAETLP
jgi:hypothetical protein